MLYLMIGSVFGIILISYFFILILLNLTSFCKCFIFDCGDSTDYLHNALLKIPNSDIREVFVNIRYDFESFGYHIMSFFLILWASLLIMLLWLPLLVAGIIVSTLHLLRFLVRTKKNIKKLNNHAHNNDGDMIYIDSEE